MIIWAAIPLIAEYGATVTTAKIARAVGIGEGTIFRVFADKDELLQACMAKALSLEHAVRELTAIDPSRCSSGSRRRPRHCRHTCPAWARSPVRWGIAAASAPTRCAARAETSRRPASTRSPSDCRVPYAVGGVPWRSRPGRSSWRRRSRPRSSCRAATKGGAPDAKSSATAQTRAMCDVRTAGPCELLAVSSPCELLDASSLSRASTPNSTRTMAS
ncbi:TetR/AcrR family transcriptional regulator [Streptomyces chartreusis]|uniref:TetR/AcrR family transcriptional regulator n=1 Tax=Streptomyces chartreusis TaxID=1969 RepID=UPI0037F405C6